MKGEMHGCLCGLCSVKSRVGMERSKLLPLPSCGFTFSSAGPGPRKPWMSCHTAPESWLLERSVVVVAAAAAVNSCPLSFIWGHGALGWF